MTIASLWARITNLAFHNRSRSAVPRAAKKLLSFGPKFIYSPEGESLAPFFDKSFKAGHDKVLRATRLHLIFSHQKPQPPVFYHFIPPPSSFEPSSNNLAEDLRLLDKELCDKLLRVKGFMRARLARPSRPNISVADRWLLACALEHPQISIVLADKNMGFCAVDDDWLLSAILAQLGDPGRYLRLDPKSGEEALTTAVNRFRLLLLNLNPFDKGSRHAQLFREMKSSLAVLDRKAPFAPCTVKPLAKVHKPSLQLRLITQAHRSPFQPFCYWFAKLLHPVTVSSVRAYLRDSSDLLAALLNVQLELDQDVTIVTADAANLYGNLPLVFVQEALQWALLKLVECGHLEPGAVRPLLKLAELTNLNCFVEFGPFWYQQTTGIAMGRADGVDLANLTLGLIEERVLFASRTPPGHPRSPFILYGRYIDDVFAVVRGQPEDAKRALQPVFDESGVDWNIQCVYFPAYYSSRTCPKSPLEKANFLDLSIWRDGKTLKTALFTKETSLALYIPPLSLHAPHSFRGWIKAEALRFVRNCSDEHDYLLARQRFYWNLRARGFSSNFLRPLLLFSYANARRLAVQRLEKLSNTPRSLRMLTQDKERIFSKKIFFPLHFHSRLTGFSPSFFLAQSLKPVVEHVNRNRLLRQGPSPPLISLSFSTAWRSLPSLAALVDRAFKAHVLGKLFPPNPNLGETSPERRPTSVRPGGGVAAVASTSDLAGIVNGDLLDIDWDALFQSGSDGFPPQLAHESSLPSSPPLPASPPGDDEALLILAYLADEGL